MRPNHPEPTPETQARIRSKMWTETRGCYAFVAFIGLILILAAHVAIEGMR